MGFVIAFFAIELVSYFGLAVCFLMAFLAAGIIGSWELPVVNGINVYSSWKSSIVFSNILILFFLLVSLGLESWLSSGFFGLAFLLLFILIVVNFNSFFSKVSEAYLIPVKLI
jgi:membrane protein required for beta-lactamase induction